MLPQSLDAEDDKDLRQAALSRAFLFCRSPAISRDNQPSAGRRPIRDRTADMLVSATQCGEFPDGLQAHTEARR